MSATVDPSPPDAATANGGAQGSQQDGGDTQVVMLNPEVAAVEARELQQASVAAENPRTGMDAPTGSEGALVTSSVSENAEQLDWLKYFNLAQQTLDVANTAQSAGFGIAKSATGFGLRAARFFTKHALALPAMAIDAAAGTPPDGSGTLHSAASTGVDGLFDVVDTVALGSLDVSSAITAASLSAASTGMGRVSSSLDSDVARSLSTFGRLVSREWNRQSHDLPAGGLPAYDRLTIARAILCWISLQSMTAESYEQDILRHLTLVANSDHDPNSHEDATDPALQLGLGAHPRVRSLVQHSRLILAIYGGAIMALLNSLPEDMHNAAHSPDTHGSVTVEASDTTAGVLSLDVAERQGETSARALSSSTGDASIESSMASFSYADLLSGKYDHYLLHNAAGVTHAEATPGSYDDLRPAAPELDGRISTSRPNYYVITSHETRKIIVVMRGTITLGDVATDLTCESQSLEGIVPDAPPGSLVHSGMLVTALAVGRPGAAVHRAVHAASLQHPDYDIDLIGHSLGAGVMALLCLLWGSPSTGKTRESIGLGNRGVHAYCYAVPCVMDKALGAHCERIITSFVSSWDLVSRLSLGSVTDIRNVIAWLCYWEKDQQKDFTCASFIRNTFEYQSGRLDSSVSAKQRFEDDAADLMRQLRPHMNGVHLYPPGKTFVTFRNSELKTIRTERSPLLFEVTGDRAEVFDRIAFRSGMLSDHLPQVYVKNLSELYLDGNA